MGWLDAKKKKNLEFVTSASPGQPLGHDHREKCAFCQQPRSDIQMLVAGATASICNECIVRSAEIMQEHTGRCSFCGEARQKLFTRRGAAICSLCATDARSAP